MVKPRNKLFGLAFLVFAQFSFLGAVAYGFKGFEGLTYLWILAGVLTLIIMKISDKFAHNPDDYEDSPDD